MPGSDALYVERMSVRPRWWLVVIAVALGASAELFAGFTWEVIVVVVAAVLVPTVTLLAWAGRTKLVVDAEGITAAGQTMPFDEMESVEGLDARRTRLILGPQADPAARLVVRGYIHESVLIRPLRSAPTPYWLVSTRRPSEVIAAVERAARASRVP